MRVVRFHRGRFVSAGVCLASAVLVAQCGGGSSGPTSPSSSSTSTLPNISAFLATPSTRFVSDPSTFASLAGIRPYMGALSGCDNHAMNLWYAAKDTDYTVDMYAPADGIVTHVDTCLNTGLGQSTGGMDRYGVIMDFATYGGANVSLGISGEPALIYGNADVTTQQSFPCSGGVPGQDNGFYKQFIFVKEGDHVAAGQRIMQLYTFPLSYYPASARSNRGVTHSTSDVSLHKGPNNNGGAACPNIFSSSIEAQLAPYYAFSGLGQQAPTCNGAPYPAAICNLPGPGENIVGR